MTNIPALTVVDLKLVVKIAKKLPGD